jgi:hypothetical protein
MMPRVEGEFIPHGHCTVASGDCFTQGRCLRQCSAKQKKDQAQRITDLEARVLMLEKALYRKEKPC